MKPMVGISLLILLCIGTAQTKKPVPTVLEPQPFTGEFVGLTSHGQANDGRVEMILAVPPGERPEGNVARTIQVLEARLEYLSAQVRFREGKFLVLLPGSSVEQQDSIIKLATEQGKLAFRIVKESAESKPELTEEDLEPSLFDGSIVGNASLQSDNGTRFSVVFDILPDYQDAFAEFTSSNINRYLAITLDGDVLITPVIFSGLREDVQISGDFSLEEAQDLALVLNAGPLPFPLTFEEIRLVPPAP